MIGRDYDNKDVKMIFSPLITYTKCNSLVRNISLPLLLVQLSRLASAREWKGYHKIITDKKHSVSRTSVNGHANYSMVKLTNMVF